MPIEYDHYYQTENLFGEPYPELIRYFAGIRKKGKLLDIGCGQGRDAIALARMGFEVTGIDHSKVGIQQLNAVAKREGLSLVVQVEDLYEFYGYDEYDFILLDSMFHFEKKEREQETQLLKQIMSSMKPGAQVVICIQKTGEKLHILQSITATSPDLKLIHQEELTYVFEDKSSSHRSETQYELVAWEKQPLK